jgi:3-oxoacyl-[acyl-carrier-protein] synthase III
MMQFKQTYLQALAYEIPPYKLSSLQVEEKLQLLFQKLQLPKGTLEQLTGVKERRLWPKEQKPSSFAVAAGAKALQKAQVKAENVDLLLFTGVCRDYMEPATACIVHAQLGLSPHCLVFDLGNACLGFLTGLQTAAAFIESGQVKTALIVTGENATALYENTFSHLQENISHESFRTALASLTLGSAAVAAVLTGEERNHHGHRLHASVGRVASQFHHLCRGEGSYASPLMQTETGDLMKHGLEVAAHNWDDFLTELSWQKQTCDHLFTHQVSLTHHHLFFKKLDLDLQKSRCDMIMLGNTGSAAVPLSLALAEEQGSLQPGQHIALLGIGSGITTSMVGITW